MSDQLRHKMINYETPPPNAVWNAIAAKLEDDKQYAALSARILDTELTPPGAAWSSIASRLDDDKQNNSVLIKLNHFEVAPPLSSWETIATRLDDDKKYFSIAARLNDFETTPPKSAWETIVERLNDDKQYVSLATRLNNFEVTPPRNAWNTVDARLSDDVQHDNVLVKWQNFSAAPPPPAWDNIAAALAETNEEAKPVINIRRNIYRMAAAAIVIGFCIGGWLFVNKSYRTELVKNSQKIKPADQTVNEKNKNIQAKNTASQKIEIIASINQTGQDTKGKHNTTTIAEADNNLLLKHAVVNDLLTYQQKPIVVHSTPILDEEGNIIVDMDVLTTSNYIVVMGPNGQTTRISSKFASVIRFLDNKGDDAAATEEYLDKVIKESDVWKKRFQEWRSKISQSSFIPSASNFLDIVEFKELIEEKQ